MVAANHLDRVFLHRERYLSDLNSEDQRQFSLQTYLFAETLMQSVLGNDFSFENLPLWSTDRAKTKSGYVMYGRRGDFLNFNEPGSLSIRFVKPGEELTGLTLARQKKRTPYTVFAIDMLARASEESMFFYSSSFKGNAPLAWEIVLTAIESCRNDIFVYSHAANSQLSKMRYPVHMLLQAYKKISD